MCRVGKSLAIFALTLAGPALAEPVGPRVTALAGMERTDAAPGAGASDGVYYGGQIGYDWHLGPVIAGMEGEVGESDASQIANGGSANQGLFASATVRVALPLSSTVRAFARGGYAYHEIDYAAAPAFRGNGWTVGAGGEADLTERLFIRGEYRFSDYGRAVRGQHFLLGAGVRF